MTMLLKNTAYAQGRMLSNRLIAPLISLGYNGPLAVAGGYVRDIALGREPKDLDIWLDQGAVPECGGDGLAQALCNLLGDGWEHQKTLMSYGTWSKDIAYVCKLQGPPRMYGPTPIPGDIDFIVLMRDALMEQGYNPNAYHVYDIRESFLMAVLSRVDLRLNAIGVTSAGAMCHESWEDDVALRRLVVQHARVEEEMGRIDRRLDRLSTTKYDGWQTFYEQKDGTLMARSS